MLILSWPIGSRIPQGNHGFGPKIRWALNRARVLADEGKKVLIWSNFVDNVSLIADELEDIGTVFIKGDVPVEESWKEGYIALDEGSEEERTREQMIREFKTNDDCMVMVANPAAAGEIGHHDVCHHAIYIVGRSTQHSSCNLWTGFTDMARILKDRSSARLILLRLRYWCVGILSIWWYMRISEGRWMGCTNG